MTRIAIAVVLVALASPPAAEPERPAAPPAPSAAPAAQPATPAAQRAAPQELAAALIPGLGGHLHPITTRVPEAQKFFDQGLVLGFGLESEEAVRSFRRAAALDSQAAMPLWGVAWALGPEVERRRDPGRDREAFQAVQKAMTLSKDGSTAERDWIEALAKRYSADEKADPAALDGAYREAMRALVAKWPDDLDAATLYARSIMVLHAGAPWPAGGPAPEDTAETVAVLESVLRRDPDHPGANLDFIRALEASPHPEAALSCAARLETLVPMAGQLLHMPAHVYMRTGDYAAAARAGERAVEADRARVRDFGKTPSDPLRLHTHHLLSLAAARQMQGRQDDATRAAQAARENVLPGLGPGAPAPELLAIAETAWPQPLFVMLRFRKWDDVLKDPEPDGRLLVSTALRQAARAIACSARRDWACAEAGQAAFEEARAKVPSETAFGRSLAHDVLNIAGFVVDGRLSEARGRRDDGLAAWRSAVQAWDSLSYDDPDDWYYPLRESLGGALLRAGKAQEAETTFRADLERHPRNGRSLFGLWRSLEAQKKTEAAALVKTQFDRAWKDADVTLRVEDL